ncbi:MAG: transglycosylase domain-containing protein, partial [Actinomycetota bacterium]|nr:transglycosylase domain-containing protein [Actinomycetota bacterium]
RSPWRRLVQLTLVAVVFLAVAGVAAGGAFYLKVRAVVDAAPGLSELTQRANGENSRVYAADGRLLGFVRSDTLRTPLAADRIPERVKQATVAIEDRRFYRHRGVDHKSILRALYNNVRRKKVVQGGSTLTMQLVRALYLSSEQTVERKIIEAKLAEEMERKRSKRWILATYVNNVSYGTRGGQELIGIQAAARGWFGRPPGKLRVHELALLAGLPQAPSRLDPVKHPERAKARRAAVLRAMAEEGHIEHATALTAMRRPLGITARNFYERHEEPYFFDYVKAQLVERYGTKRVKAGGLKVFTTIDRALQRRARKAMRAQLPERGDPEAALVSLDPQTGDIRAMASTSSYRRSKFSLAAQARRQPGSTFKTMVLAAAVQQRIDPHRTTYASAPIDHTSEKYGQIKVKTYSGTYGARRTSVAAATLASDNTVFMRLTLDVSPGKVRSTARRLGVRSPLRANPAIGLGGLEHGVSPLEMTSAYATLASDGVRARPRAIRKVVFADGRRELIKPHRRRAVRAKTARVVTSILERNIQQGTGTAARIHCPAAGKTGTTDDYKDAWFAGYVPRLATTVWVGHPKPRPMRDVHGIQVAGGTFPARIWGRYMRDAVETCRPFEPAESVGPALKPLCGKRTTTRRLSCMTRAQREARERRLREAARERAAREHREAQERNEAQERRQPRARLQVRERREPQDPEELLREARERILAEAG